MGDARAAKGHNHKSKMDQIRVSSGLTGRDDKEGLKHGSFQMKAEAKASTSGGHSTLGRDRVPAAFENRLWRILRLFEKAEDDDAG